jgi:ABC-type nitrate/sulfonate/bicarbonate transport system permease component
MTWRDWTARLHLPTLAVGVVILAAWSALSWRYGAFVLPTRSRPVRDWATSSAPARSGATPARRWRGSRWVSAARSWRPCCSACWRFLSPLARGVVADGLAGLNSTSVFVWIVISIIWFGLSNWAPIFTTLMITLPVVASNIVEGVASVDRRLLEMGDVYRLSGARKFRAIVVPSTLPYLIAGMKVGFGLALKVSVVAEIFGVTSGIGYIMNYSREILATQMVFVWAIVMILVMTATDKLLFDRLSRHLTRWR